MDQKDNETIQKIQSQLGLNYYHKSLDSAQKVAEQTTNKLALRHEQQLINYSNVTEANLFIQNNKQLVKRMYLEKNRKERASYLIVFFMDNFNLEGKDARKLLRSYWLIDKEYRLIWLFTLCFATPFFVISMLFFSFLSVNWLAFIFVLFISSCFLSITSEPD